MKLLEVYTINMDSFDRSILVHSTRYQKVCHKYCITVWVGVFRALGSQRAQGGIRGAQEERNNSSPVKRSCLKQAVTKRERVCAPLLKYFPARARVSFMKR